jgi:mRNA interferase MazF
VRPIHLARLDKQRPVLILTRAEVREVRALLTVAPISSTVRGLLSEVPVGKRNGIGHDSVVQCDNILTVETDRIGRLIGYLHPEQEMALTEAIVAAFDLE